MQLPNKLKYKFAKTNKFCDRDLHKPVLMLCKFNESSLWIRKEFYSNLDIIDVKQDKDAKIGWNNF